MSSTFLLSRRLTSLKFVQKRFSSLLSTPKQEELRIPVPWGHIAGTQIHVLSYLFASEVGKGLLKVLMKVCVY